jgi:hypothetical protein
MQNDEQSGDDLDVFPELLAAMQRQFAPHADQPLLLTAATGLWETFLGHVPPAFKARYTCNSCRRFVERYGSLVSVDDEGGLTPVLWPREAPAGFGKAFSLVGEAVVAADIAEVLVPPQRVLGTPSTPASKTGRIWSHFHVQVARANTHALLDPSQVQAERKEERGMLARGLAEFPLPLVERAHALLTSGTLYRSEKCIGASTWLVQLHHALASASSQRQRDALVWRAAASAPPGFAHVRSGMIGTLLEDLASDMPIEAVKRRFDDKMSPSQYMRAQAAPTAGNIAEAERVIARLNAAGALDRRYARLSDIPRFLWQPRQPEPAAAPGGVFSHLTPKARPAAGKMALPQQTLTWEKFVRTVLPDAIDIEAQVPATADRFMALVTAASPEAPPILQWDKEEGRNPVSWYYHAGIDAEMKRRVEEAGGQYTGVDIRASLLWNNRNDLDLHVHTPAGEHIYFGAKQAKCRGWLDVDMNVRGETTTPVENVRWVTGTAQRGRYRIHVQNYRFHEKIHSPTPFKVEVEISGEVYHFNGVISPNRETSAASDILVFDFDYQPGQKLARPPPQAAPPREDGRWNVTPGSWAKVTGIVTSPNLWSDTPLLQHGRHTFFLLKGCRDTTSGEGRGFFTETLRADFHSVRATLEAYNRTATIAGAEEAEACGLGMTDQQPWNLVLRVTTASAVTSYVIDRMD